MHTIDRSASVASGSAGHAASAARDSADRTQDDPFRPARPTRYTNTAAETVTESEGDTDAHSAVTSPPLSSSAIPGSRVTSPRSALSPVGRSIPLAQSQQQQQQQQQHLPWWLRESRRELSPATVKAAIPASPSQASMSAPGRRAERVAPYANAAGGFVSPPGPPALPAASSSRGPPAESKQDVPSMRFRSEPKHRAVPPVSPGMMGRQGPIHLSTRLSRRERALWTWMNVQDLDLFLQEVRLTNRSWRNAHWCCDS